MKGAECRGCGRPLNGTAYYLGGSAYIPESGDKAKVNFYGGYVCSRDCDKRVSLDMSSSMPGAGKAHRLNTSEAESLRANWG
jgi:hypothetical protein